MELHSQFNQLTETFSNGACWLWLIYLNLTRKTETLITSTEEQTVKANLIKAKIGEAQSDSKRRICRPGEESINHTLDECRAQKLCKRDHDCVGKRAYWDVSLVCY